MLARYLLFRKLLHVGVGEQRAGILEVFLRAVEPGDQLRRWRERRVLLAELAPRRAIGYHFGIGYETLELVVPRRDCACLILVYHTNAVTTLSRPPKSLVTVTSLYSENNAVTAAA